MKFLRKRHSKMRTVRSRRVEALTDEQIRAGIAADPDAATETAPEFWGGARLVLPADREKK